jgi:hypothetical protein
MVRFVRFVGAIRRGDGGSGEPKPSVINGYPAVTGVNRVDSRDDET